MFLRCGTGQEKGGNISEAEATWASCSKMF